ESIREFQKEAIWRQMQEYKRDAQRATGLTAAAEQRQARWEERIAAVCAGWSRAIHDLEAIFNPTENPAAAGTQSGAATQETWLEIMLPRSGPSGPVADAAAAADSVVAADAQSGIERFYDSVNSVLRQLQSGSSAPTTIDWAAAVDRLACSRGAADNINDLQSQVALLSRRLSETREALEQRELDLRHTLKRLDRKLCPTVRDRDRDDTRTSADVSHKSDATSPARAAGPADNGQPTEPYAAAAAPAAPSPSGADTPSVSTAATNGSAAPVPSTQKTQETLRELADYKLLAEQRLAEIEERMRENSELVMQVDSLRLQIASVPDYIISETALYKQTEAGRNHYGAQAQRLQAEVDRLLGEAGELRTSRGAFEEGVVAEATAQRAALDAELQRLQSDLVRVRHHRDQVQRELEERRAQDAVEDQKSSELKLLSEVRRERMNALISENKRLLAYIAMQRGDRTAFETYTDEELSKATTVADELRAKLEQVTRRERHLSERLGALSVRGDG
ncbi:E3 ubiquitin-protein ligase bre1, partial [Coemansia spiralis]